mgnify:CR=1 FL=1
MKSSPDLRLPNPVPAPTSSDCCPKRKGSLPKIWRLHPSKMVLSTRSRVTAPPWIPGKGPADFWGHAYPSLTSSLPSQYSVLGLGAGSRVSLASLSPTRRRRSHFPGFYVQRASFSADLLSLWSPPHQACRVLCWWNPLCPREIPAQAMKGSAGCTGRVGWTPPGMSHCCFWN